MPRNSSPRDLTGLTAERLATAKKREDARSDLTTITPEFVDEYETGVTEIAPPKYEKEIRDEEGNVDGYEIVEVEQPKKQFRVNSDIEDMTFGAGNNYSFYTGKLYSGPKSLYDHLDTLGYIWH